MPRTPVGVPWDEGALTAWHPGAVLLALLWSLHGPDRDSRGHTALFFQILSGFVVVVWGLLFIVIFLSF